MRKITFFLSFLLIFIGGVTANASTAVTPAAGKYYHIKVGDNYIDNAIPVYEDSPYPDCFHLSGNAADAAVFRLEAVADAENTFYIDYIGNGTRPSGRVLYTGNNGAGTVVLGNPSATQNNTWEIAAKSDGGYTIISGGTQKGGFNNWQGGTGLLALWSDTGSATGCTFEEVDATLIVKNITYRYAEVEGTNFGSYTVDQLKNTPPCAWAPLKLLTNLTYDVETLETGDAQVTVTCGAVYPFVPTTMADGKLADDTKWYTMNVNQWPDKTVYTGEGEEVMVNSTRVFDANHLWCFERVAGTLDQFRIYNLEKGAGAPLTLVKNTSYEEFNQATASTGTGGEETTQFRLVPNGAGYCIQHPDQPQANIGNHVDDFFAVWQGAGSPTHNKSRIFFQSADDLIAEVQRIKESEFVGGYVNVPAQLTEKINTYKTTKNVENLKNLADANKAAVAGGMERRMLKADKYYELLTYKRAKGARLYLDPSTASGTVEADLDAKASKGCSVISSLWQFVPTTDGRYKVTHANTGKSLGTGRSSSGNQTLMNVPANDGNAGTYVLVGHNTECDVWGVQCGNNKYLNMNRNGDETVFMYHEGPSKDEGSPWQLREVSEIEVSLNAVDGEGSVATLHLPFNATVKEGGTTVNVGVLNDDKSKLMLSPVSGVPANTGVVLHNAESAASVTLTVGGDVEAAASALLGTNVSISLTDENRADNLIFALSAGELGFYSPSASVTQLAANKAYLPAAGLTPNGVRLMLGGDPTGIGHAVATDKESNAPLYDLSGRRVKEAVKGGIYLRNGKKFIVK